MPVPEPACAPAAPAPELAGLPPAFSGASQWHTGQMPPTPAGTHRPSAPSAGTAPLHQTPLGNVADTLHACANHVAGEAHKLRRASTMRHRTHVTSSCSRPSYISRSSGVTSIPFSFSPDLSFRTSSLADAIVAAMPRCCDAVACSPTATCAHCGRWEKSAFALRNCCDRKGEADVRTFMMISWFCQRRFASIFAEGSHRSSHRSF